MAWQLRARPVCASTERELDRWLAAGPAAVPPTLPRAVLAARQRFGHGQRGRPWSSPAGGVWISAALPWPAQPSRMAAPALAVAVGLALELEDLLAGPRGGVGRDPAGPVRIKWPNDLLLSLPRGGVAKVAGLLPRLRLRGGAIRWAQVGVGLNGVNRVPAGAVACGAALLQRPAPAFHPLARPDRLAARVLRALEWAMAHATAPERVRREAERRLWLPPGPVRHEGLLWRPVGLGADGSLTLRRGERRASLHRPF